MAIKVTRDNAAELRDGDQVAIIFASGAVISAPLVEQSGVLQVEFDSPVLGGEPDCFVIRYDDGSLHRGIEKIFVNNRSIERTYSEGDVFKLSLVSFTRREDAVWYGSYEGDEITMDDETIATFHNSLSNGESFYTPASA